VKIKTGYRIEVLIRRGILRRSGRNQIWDAFENSTYSSISASTTEKKAIAIYDRLVEIGFKEGGQVLSVSKLEKEIRDFILWLTPCGQVNPSPQVKIIGLEARKINRKIIAHLTKKKGGAL